MLITISLYNGNLFPEVHYSSDPEVLECIIALTSDATHRVTQITPDTSDEPISQSPSKSTFDVANIPQGESQSNPRAPVKCKGVFD